MFKVNNKDTRTKFFNSSKFTDPSFIPLPPIFNSSIAFFSSLIVKIDFPLRFVRTHLFSPLVGNLFFHFCSKNQFRLMSCLNKLEGTLISNLVILHLTEHNA